MNYKRLALFTLLFSSLLGAIQCKKEKKHLDNPYGLPNATQTGALTFACVINGQSWIAPSRAIQSIGGGVTQDSVYAFGRHGSGVYFQTLYFKSKKAIRLDETIILDDDANYFEIGGDHDCRGTLMYPYRYRGKGQVRFTRIDEVNKVMSGMYSCTIPIPGCDTLKMTEGRFDIRYYN